MALLYDDLVAVYPASPIFKINDAKINIIENLKRLKNSLIESLKKALGNERIIFIRMAHVGLSPRKVNSHCLPYCKEIYSQNQQCIFIPIKESSQRRLYNYVEVIGAQREPMIITASKLGFPNFHADPLIYAKHKPNRRTVLSLTYGENDVESILIWLEIPRQLEIDVSKIDAYVLFNTTFFLSDYEEKLQFIHGGFKAEAWDYIQCFSEDYRQQYPNECFVNFDNYIRTQEMKERLNLNPHWLRGDQNKDPDKEGTILMMLGDKNKWFFSLPLAPHPLYYLAQQSKNKIETSRKIIREFFGKGDYDIDSKIDEIKSLLSIDERMVKDLRNLVKDYYNGHVKLTDELRKYINFVTESLRGYRKMKAIKSLKEYGITPQFRGDVIYSYLDVILSSNTDNKLAWIWVLLVVLLMDIYVDRFENIFM